MREDLEPQGGQEVQEEERPAPGYRTISQTGLTAAIDHGLVTGIVSRKGAKDAKKRRGKMQERKEFCERTQFTGSHKD